MSVTPEDVLRFTAPTRDFLCPLSANTYGIEFLSFKICDGETGGPVFEVAKDEHTPPPVYPDGFDMNLLRTINYRFPSAFLSYSTVATTLRFRVGPKEVKNFRMIERHYFRNRLVKSYDFTFAFCIPNSTNEWEAVYDMPPFTQTLIDEILQSREGTSSDSFYFVDGELIMHNKAFYTYVNGNEDGDDSAAVAAGATNNASSSSSSSSSSAKKTSK